MDRKIPLGVLTLLVCSLAVVSSTALTVQAQVDNPDTVVSPGESIQDAIDAAAPGDTVQLESGTYEQGIVVDKDLRITTSGDVRLDGNAIDAQDGIVVDAADVTIEGVEIARFSDNGIDVRGNVLAQREIEILNVTARLNDDINIVVSDGTERDTVILRNVVSRNPSFDDGMEINAENVTVENTVVEQSGDVGLDVAAGDEGEVVIRDSVFSDNGESDSGFEDLEQGILVRSTEQLRIEDTEVTGSADTGISLSDTDAIAGGRTVILSNVTTRANFDGNIFIGETDDRDSVVLTDVVSRNPSFDDGISTTGENVTVENTVVEQSEDVGLDIAAGGDGEVVIRDSVFSDNGESDSGFEDLEQGILVRSTKQLRIEDTEVTGSADTGITLFDNDVTAGGRTVVLSNVTSRANVDGNIFIGETDDRDSVVLTDVVSRNPSFDDGISTTGENVTVENTVVEQSEDVGLDIAAGGDGEVVIRDSVFSDNGESDSGTEDLEQGILVKTAKQLTIEDTEVTGSADTGISLLSNSVTAGGRTVTLANVTSRANDGNGAFVSGTTDADSVSVANSTIGNNGDDGLDIEVETATVSQTRISNNSERGVVFGGAFTGGTVDRSSILDNGGESEIAIVNDVDGATVDATNNWWGDPGGPDESDLAGAVDAADPLSTPPGEDGGQDGPGDSQSISLEPASANTTVSETVTYDVVVGNVTGGGVGTYDNITISVGDTGVASVTEVSDATGAGASVQTIAADGSSATIAANFGGDTADTGNVTVATVTLDAAAAGTTALDVSLDGAVFDEDGSAYTLAEVRGGQLTVREGSPEILPGTPAGDTNDDGLLDDLNGNGAVDRGDAQALFSALGSEVLANNVDRLDRNGNGAVDRGDVQAVFATATS